MKRAHAQPTEYPVEISGWTAEGKYFVETTSLIWEQTIRRVQLRQEVTAGARLFVKLKMPGKKESALPLPYEAVGVGEADQWGVREIQLAQILPQPGRIESTRRASNVQMSKEGGSHEK